ncbi:MAG TPA: hypothetical protein PLN56_08730 [Methanoregulaceae archaeon]|nr:MAG: hypothetical protein IPI71_00325 [Methanolinea sp.]HON82487.1 hypothetical protein [Methanoregulaceae archaeon]HPD11067.1 hypothetical protein [Methanoregulaceae archaeon]HRT16116.1 hypothetical protein [Methanoregulaceae archaeon]HRU31678.1 hypothetical protein [Methanoregulaceae archaeon]
MAPTYRSIVFLCLVCLIFGIASAGSLCSRVESGSSMTLSVGSISTQMGERSIFGSADAGTELYNNVLVTEYAPGIPSRGSVSAFIRGRVVEDGKILEFDDTTTIIGSITSFSKSMIYNSKTTSTLF